MRFSFYTIILYDVPADGEYLLYNTRTQALVRIGRDMKDVIDHYSDPDFFARRCHFSRELEQLHDMGVLVENEEQDLSNIEDFFEQLSSGDGGATFIVHILTTYACNFRCAYCFEEGTRCGESLDLATGDLILRWLKTHMEQRRYQKLVLVFYGGEPLLNREAISYIAGHMKEWCGRESRDFYCALQTNGYLLTPDVTEDLLALGLSHVRISLDGVDEDHDRRRPLRSGGAGRLQELWRISGRAWTGFPLVYR